MDILSASLVTAICILQGQDQCGIIQDIFVDQKKIGKGIITFEGPAEVLSSETGLPAYTISETNFRKIWNSGMFLYDIRYVIPKDPDKPIKCHVGGKYEFVSRISIN